MKLNDLINQEEEEKKEKNKIITCKESLLEKYNEFIEVGKLVGEKQTAKHIELIAKCEEEAVRFFEESDFKVEKNDNGYVARYENISINFKYDGEDEMIIFPLNILPIGIYNAIQIKPCNDQEEMLYWKKHIKLNGNDVYSSNFNNELQKCNNSSELITAILNLETNINHYKNTLENFDEIKYVYSLYKCGDIECNTFKELFEKHIN